MIKAFLRKNILLNIFIVFWATTLLIGFTFLWDYTNKPGPEGIPPKNWPTLSKLIFDEERPNLLLFAHPHCSCTNASLEELSKIYTLTKSKLNINIIFYLPKKFKREWVYTNLWKKAKKILNANIIIDSEMFEISKFNPKTSGQVYLYSKEGQLLYTGGITGSRAHVGDNVGTDTIISWVNKKELIKEKSFVFGCTLFHDEHGSKKHSTKNQEILYGQTRRVIEKIR